MAKLLKHLGLGSSKKGSPRSESSALKSSSAHNLISQSPTGLHQSGVVLSASSHHEFLDTHSLKSVASDGGGGAGGGSCSHSGGMRNHEHAGCCKQHACCRHHRTSTSNELGCRSVIHSSSVAEESDVFDDTPSDTTYVTEVTLPSSEVMQNVCLCIMVYCSEKSCFLKY